MKNTFRFYLLILFVLFLSFSLSSAAQQTKAQQSRPQPPPLKAHQVKGNIYEVKGGSGANTGFIITEKEVLVIDAKMSEESAKQMIAEIKKLTSNPMKYVIITHSDGDHINGLVGFPPDVTVVSHHQTRKDMDEAFKEPKQRLYLPILTFSKKLKLYSGNKTIKLFYFGPAHTSGDIVVYIPDEKVAFLGDLLFLGRDPLVHKHKNGNSFGLVKTLKNILKLDADTFVHGHGDIASKSDIEGVIKSLEDKQLKIKTLIKEGKSLDEIKKAFNVEDRPPLPGRQRRIGLVEAIYLEITEKK
ncbi:MAG: MBL fold metallo-hydrolase [Candidatus Aminicenantes bacterium]|nr:MBL fold metallo-hydrolase [Candidatus Aminicenantes bacterium]MBL7083090.1 MBL fold metallo-hydrolase [Candidatus Aminicenantes bacterium]